MLSELERQINVVVGMRRDAELARVIKGTAYSKWEAENKEIIEAVTQTAQRINDAEAKLRELTLGIYSQTGDKSPAIGVGIRERTKLDYDVNDAFKWAKEHALALKLDVSTFEKIAKTTSLDFVKISQEPQATISTELELIGE